MKWDIERSAQLAQQIANDRKLMGLLGENIAGILEKHRLAMEGVSYVFEPRVFRMDPDEALELSIRSPAAMQAALAERVSAARSTLRADDVLGHLRVTKCLPQCGPMDPHTLRILEAHRILDPVADDPVPIRESADLMREIVRNKAVLHDFADTVFGLLEEHGVSLEEGEGCVFTPLVFDTPVYAQKVGYVEDPGRMIGFCPQVLADPTPEPAFRIRPQPFPGIIETDLRPLIGVIWPPRWWIGIPAPELLRALDVMRDHQ